jgi:hypothetical protein
MGHRGHHFNMFAATNHQKPMRLTMIKRFLLTAAMMGFVLAQDPADAAEGAWCSLAISVSLENTTANLTRSSSVAAPQAVAFALRTLARRDGRSKTLNGEAAVKMLRPIRAHKSRPSSTWSADDFDGGAHIGAYRLELRSAA